MALLFRCDSLSKWYGQRQLFSDISISFDENERTGLIGANGSGKSTLLRILAGAEEPDSGTLTRRRNLRLGYVPQADAFAAGATVRDVLIRAWDDPHVEEHDRDAKISALLTRIGFDDSSQAAAELSGGWRKRLAIARELIREPDMLLLDEPTNHLDLEGIFWLEKLLANAPFAFLVVSHDRYFLENVTSRTIELSAAYADGYLSVASHYSDFLVKKQERLAAQASLEQSLASRMRREIAWLGRQAKARTTKAKGRIQEAGRMASDLADLQARNSQGKSAALDFVGTERQTRKLLVAEGISKSLGGRVLFENLNLVLGPGMKLGLVGPNGVGKSTLIKILAGELPADSGTIRWAEKLKIVLFDQARQKLDQNQTLKKALSPGGETVVFRGQPMHVSGWARRFLFRTEQLDMPVSDLSGGEQARILIAAMMLQPADLLILDEPTNDLDIASLEVLEESLTDFPGALVLVTHDRYLLENLSSDLLALDGKGNARLLADLSQYERPGPQKKTEKGPKNVPPATTGSLPSKPRKLSYLEQREWDQMESAVMAAEALLAQKQRLLDDVGLMADYKKMAEAGRQVADAQKAVETIYARWEELETRRGGR